jgi:signal transduction histidine kinase
MSMLPLAPVYLLLVDDLEENLLALEGLLRRDGLTLLKARSGREALELLLQYDAALALVDVQMPEMDGFELAEIMRGSARTRNVPIIFLTAGSADQQRRFRGYEAGAVDFLQKPIEPDVLKGKASVFFDLYRQRQEVARQRDELRIATEENAKLLMETQQYAAALKENDRRKDEFLATLAHELRNPLAPICNGLQILRQAPNDDIGEKVREMMHRQLAHMVRLIDDLLDMSRVSKGKIELRKERVELQVVIESALESSRPQIEVGRHVLTSDVPDEPVWLDADLTRLAQVISNLLNNAAKYTPEGGHIGLTVRRERETVTIVVSDDGVGIPPDMQARIFELFTQLGDTLVHSQGGLGIGLALAKHLVELHGGTIRGESPGPGKGSTFTVCLPVAVAELNSAPMAGAQIARTRAAGLRVLVVDDNIDAAETTAWMLEALGHHPTLAYDGTQALAMARALRPQAILMDIGLPGMNGYEVCRLLRQDSLFKDTLIIAQTGWGQQRDRQMAQEAGFDHHLVKPVHLDDVAGLLADITVAS